MDKQDAYDENGRQTKEEKQILRMRQELRDATDVLEILKKPSASWETNESCVFRSQKGP